MLSDGGDVQDQSSCLLQGIQAKVYQPLLQRPTCSKYCVSIASVSIGNECVSYINHVAFQ
jgi:hypothetical protein